MSKVRIEITAGGIYGADGKEIPVGSELTVREEPKAWAGRYRVIGKGEGTPVVNPAADEAPSGPFTVEDGGKGWWSILDAKGEKVGKGLREDDAKAFRTLTEAEQVEFAAEHAKA
jgi:hypothetical protein